MTVDPLIQSLKGKLIVSVQAYMGEPLRTPETMAQMSRACELGGAAAIRCQGLADIAAIKGRCEVPVIGLWKDGHEGVVRLMFLQQNFYFDRKSFLSRWFLKLRVQ